MTSTLLDCVIFATMISALPVYAVEKGDLLINYQKQTPDSVLVTCAYCGDEQEPRMMLVDKDRDEISVNTFVSNEFDFQGQCYLVNMQLLMLDALLPTQTTFECVLKDSGTGAEKRKTIDYTKSSSTSDQPSLWMAVLLPTFVIGTVYGSSKRQI